MGGGALSNLIDFISDLADRLRKLSDNQAAFAKLSTAIQANIQKENDFMSQITDWATQEQADLTAISATLDAIVTGVQALDTLITNFQANVGVLSTADQDALDQVKAASDALVTKAGAISTTAPGTTPPAA